MVYPSSQIQPPHIPDLTNHTKFTVLLSVILAMKEESGAYY